MCFILTLLPVVVCWVEAGEPSFPEPPVDFHDAMERDLYE